MLYPNRWGGRFSLLALLTSDRPRCSSVSALGDPWGFNPSVSALLWCQVKPRAGSGFLGALADTAAVSPWRELPPASPLGLNCGIGVRLPEAYLLSWPSATLLGFSFLGQMHLPRLYPEPFWGPTQCGWLRVRPRVLNQPDTPPEWWLHRRTALATA